MKFEAVIHVLLLLFGGALCVGAISRGSDTYQLSRNGVSGHAIVIGKDVEHTVTPSIT